MSIRRDSEQAFFQTAGEDSACYALTISNATAYLDVPPGYYDCWIPGGAAADHVRIAYLPYPDPASPPTLAAWPAPTPAVAGLGTPRRLTAGAGNGMLPANASPMRIYVPGGYRVAIVYSIAGPATLYASKVL